MQVRKPFIFSHGLGGNLAQMREPIGELPNIRLIDYDSRGHGYTSVSAIPKRLNFSEMADDMAALFDRPKRRDDCSALAVHSGLRALRIF